MSAVKTKIILDTNILVDMERIFNTLQPKITPKPSYKELWQQIINDRTIISSDKYLDKQYKNDYKGGINAIHLIHDLYNQQEKFEIHIPSFVYNEFTFRMSSKISVPVRSDLKDSPTSLLKSLEDLHIVKHIDRTELSEGVDYPNKYKVKNPKKPTKAEEAKLTETMLEFLRNKQSNNNNVQKLLQHLSETTQTNIDTVTKNLKKLITDVHNKYELWDKKMQKLFNTNDEPYKTKTELLNSLYTGITEYPNKIPLTSGEEILTQCLVKNGEIFDFFDLQIYLYAKEHDAYILTQNTEAFQEVNDPHFLNYFHDVPILHPLINFESLTDLNHIENLQSTIKSAISRDFGEDIILSTSILEKLELSKLDNTAQDIIKKIQSEYFNSNAQQYTKELKSVLQDYPLLDTIKLFQFEGDTLKVNADKLFSLKNLNENNKIKILEFINKNFFQQELKQTNFIYTTHQSFTELIKHSKSKSTVILELLKNKNKLSEYDNKDSQILADFLMTLKDGSNKDKQSLLFKALVAQNLIDIKEIIWDLKLKIDTKLKDNANILNLIKTHINHEITQKKSSLEGKNQITLIREMQNYFEYIKSPDGLENIKKNEDLKLDVQRHIKSSTDNFITGYQEQKLPNIDYKRSFVNERISTDSKSITKFLSVGMKKHVQTQELIKNFVKEYFDTKNQNVQETDITAEFIEKSPILNQDPAELTETLLQNERLLKKFIAHELSQEVTEYKWNNLMKITTNPQESSFLSFSVQEVIKEYLSKSNDVSITSIQQMSQIDIQNLIEQRKTDINHEIREKQQRLEEIQNDNNQLQRDNKKKENILKQAKVSLERELNELKIEKNKISDHNQYIEDLKEHERKIKEHHDHDVSEDHIHEHEVHEHMRGEHKGRIKRFMQDIDVEESDNITSVQNQNNTYSILFDDTTKLHNFVSSSANSIKSPINTAINWLSNSFASLKFLIPAHITTNDGFIKDGIQNIQSIFTKSEHIGNDNIKSDDTVTSMNMGQFDVNSSLTLANFVIRYFTKVKPYNTNENPVDLLGVKAYVLNIITEFEELLNDPSIQNYLPGETLEFDPVVLMSKLEKTVISGNYTKISKILYQSIVNNNSNLDETQFSSYIQDKINEILEQQNTEYLYNQRLITDYTSNSHTTAEDISNILGIANDVNHTNHQSEVNLIG